MRFVITHRQHVTEIFLLKNKEGKITVNTLKKYTAIALCILTVIGLFCTVAFAQGTDSEYDYDVSDVTDLEFYNIVNGMYKDGISKADGKTMRVAGYFRVIRYTDVDWVYYQIYRNHPDDSNIRMAVEVLYPEGFTEEYPEEGQYVEMTGTLHTYKDYNGATYLRLEVESVNGKGVAINWDVIIWVSVIVLAVAAGGLYVVFGGGRLKKIRNRKKKNKK